MQTTTLPKLGAPRIQSLDLLKGIVMVVMTLDHVRDFVHADSFYFSPTDIEKTTLPIFFTRWFTHFCAPTFSLLAGASAFLIGLRKSKPALSGFLLKRGIWLIVLEITILTFAWFFDIDFHIIILATIWALGWSMVYLAGAIWLPRWAIVATSLAMICGHNLLDGIHFEGNFLWAILHDRGKLPLGDHLLFVAYPLIPWLGVMALGYALGSLYAPSYDGAHRRQMLTRLGLGAIVAFIAINAINIYGNMKPWPQYPTLAMNFMSFLNMEKYPPSMLYLFMTLGPALVFMGKSEGLQGRLVGWISTYGKVPFFYYIIHLYAIHLVGIALVIAQGFDWHLMIFTNWIGLAEDLKGFGLGLPGTYLVWLGVVVALYPACRWFEQYKAAHKHHWWLSYL